MYDHQISAAAGSARREHLLAQAETARLVRMSRSRGAARADRGRSGLTFRFRGRVAATR
jgi:hypothetical protein